MATKRRLHVAVVGLGFGSIWVPAYKAHPDIEEVTLCDINESLLHRIGDENGIERRCTRFQDVLDMADCDAVHLLTPIPLHVEQTLAVLESGKHCACAIPMALTMADVERILDTQRRTGKNYMLMETEVYSPTFLYAQQLYQAGEFGELQFLRGVHYQNMEGWPDYWIGLPPMLYSYHGFGPILYLADKRPTTVNCVGSGRLPVEWRSYSHPYPVESALFQLEDSAVVCEVTCSFFEMVRGFLVDRFYIYGNRMGFESAQVGGEDPVIFRAAEGPLKPGQRGRAVSTQRVKIPSLVELMPGELSDYIRNVKVTRGVPLVHEFVRSIVEERAPDIDAVTAATWTAASICAHESALQGGQTVDIPSFSR